MASLLAAGNLPARCFSPFSRRGPIHANVATTESNSHREKEKKTVHEALLTGNVGGGSRQTYSLTQKTKTTHIWTLRQQEKRPNVGSSATSGTFLREAVVSVAVILQFNYLVGQM